jgi:regulator of RNase E activity RraB
MRILVHCTICLRELEQKGMIPTDGSFDSSLVTFLSDFGDEFVARGTCPRGHKYIGYITKERFDVLYESAVLAFLMGFELEAVLGFAASLERAQELFTIASLRSVQLDIEIIEKMWKQVSRQSERQLGAFLAQWLITTNQNFEISQSMIEFRNKVVHRGHIPLREETSTYASWVNDRLFDIIEVMRRWKDGPLKEMRKAHIGEAHAIALNEWHKDPELNTTPIVSVNPPYLTMLHLEANSFKRATFEKVCVMAREMAKHHGIKATAF